MLLNVALINKQKQFWEMFANFISVFKEWLLWLNHKCKESTHWKNPDAGRLKAKGQGGGRGWDH